MNKSVRRDILIMLAEELKKAADAKNDQEQLVADLLEKLGLIEYKNGVLRLTEAGKKLVTFED